MMPLPLLSIPRQQARLQRTLIHAVCYLQSQLAFQSVEQRLHAPLQRALTIVLARCIQAGVKDRQFQYHWKHCNRCKEILRSVREADSAYDSLRYRGVCACPQCGMGSHDLVKRSLPFVLREFGDSVQLRCNVCFRVWLQKREAQP